MVGCGDGEHPGGEEQAGRDGDPVQAGHGGAAACRYTSIVQ